MLPGLVLCGFGIGLANPAIAQIALGVAAPERAGMASGINNTFRMSGVAVGIAVLGSIFAAELATRLKAALPSAPAGLADAASAGGLRALRGHGLHPTAETVSAVRSAFVGAFDRITLVGACIVVVGAAVAALTVRAQDFAGAPVAALAAEG
jgi:hypothetical protein